MELDLDATQRGAFIIRYGDDQYVFWNAAMGWGLIKKAMDKLLGRDPEPLLIWQDAETGAHHILSMTPGVKVSFHTPTDFGLEGDVYRDAAD